MKEQIHLVWQKKKWNREPKKTSRGFGFWKFIVGLEHLYQEEAWLELVDTQEKHGLRWFLSLVSSEEDELWKKHTEEVKRSEEVKEVKEESCHQGADWAAKERIGIKAVAVSMTIGRVSWEIGGEKKVRKYRVDDGLTRVCNAMHTSAELELTKSKE